ncbi:putative disease resistance protein rga3 [Phtheirospermum japonicum]|uniref:Putative disease resistance protein rga3 n=1 Tax=Phtheirospermum japonicum TaxID=374723 RepID=A0A830BVM5_9LAMI|nr:putative disease resistance protein rga3 [Phtheirospermum japonicum]
MAEAVVSAAIQVLLEQLFKKDLESLKNSFDIVKAFLCDAEKKQVTNDAVKIWLRNLEDLAFEADNVFDDISYQLLSKKVGPTRNNKTSCSSNDHTIAQRLQLGPRIRDLNEKLGSINQRATELGLQTIIANAQPPVSESPETNSFSADPVYGRKYDVSTIVEKLITSEQTLSVLPINGMGGLGKTTLARKVFGDEQIISHFGDNRVWVHVPRNFDVSNILKNILTSLKNEKVELETSQALLQKIQEHLKTKRYLLVLDDVWDEDRDKWDSFVNSLSGISSATGNCMIVTTRLQEVASIVKTCEIHKLKGLSYDDCWSIIKAKAFINSGDIPMGFETVGRNIAKRCQGLPLAAKVVGGLLCDKSKDEWREIENNWLSDFGDDQNTISKILKLSFDHLSSPSLKKCFAYCSIFHKGYWIEKEQLIELWMAEGFLQSETTGSKFFNLLLQNSLLQVVERDDYGNVTHCNMHDLVHDLAFSVLCEYDNVTDGVCQRRYIGYEAIGDGLLSIPEGQERYVRTLFFSGEVCDIRFSDFKSLHTLTLVSEEDMDDLPTSITELKHLRYLDISETRIKYLPESIGELYHLQTLRAKKGSTFIMERNYLEKLPDSLNCLISLRHLHIPDSTALPPEMGKLTSLQTLPYFHVGREKGCGISELGSLKNLKGKLEIRNLEQVRNKNEAMRADLFRKQGIYELKLMWDKSREGGEANDESVLEGLQPHPNLKGLMICGFKGKSLPLLEGHANLMKISLEDCSECEELPTLGHLPHLTKLEIRDCPKMTHLVPFLGPSLLGELKIINCRSLRELPEDLHSLNSLEVLDIMDCPDLKSIPYPISSGGGGQRQQGFTSLRELEIRNCEGLTNLPIEMVESCAPSLEVLTLYKLSSITNMGMVIGCLHRMTRLRVLTILDVPKFKLSSKDIIGSLSTNNSLQVLHMGRSSSWNNNVSFNKAVDAVLLQIISLRQLTLTGRSIGTVYQISFNISLLWRD